MSTPRGRGPKFQPELAAKIIKALRSAAWRKTAAKWAGVSPRTLRDWMQRGRAKPKSVFGQFVREVEEAENEAEIRIGQLCHAQAARDPEFGLRFLAIRYRGRWNPRERVELSGDPKRPLFAPTKGIPLRDLTDDELEQVSTLAATVAARSKS